MIKVLRIINRFNLGGPTYNATYLTAFMSEDFETKLYGGPHEEHEGESLFIPQKYGLQPTLLKHLQREVNFSNDKKALKEIREIIREYQPDIVHTHASKAGALGRLAASKEGVPIIVHTFHGHVFHSYFGKLKTMVYKIAERRLAKKSDAIIAISNIQKNELVDDHKIAKADKFRVIPLGFDLQRFREDREAKRKKFRNTYHLEEDEVAIGIIGRLTSIKNHDFFLDSIRNVGESTQNKIRVFVIGDGELMDEIKEKSQAIEKQLGKKFIELTSWIKNVNDILPGLDIIALSSLNEGTPVSLIEAQAAGVPVITTNVGGVKDVVLHEETGFVVDDFSLKSYSSYLKKLVEDEKIREKMSQNGWNHVKDKYNYTRLCKDVENLYVELLKKKGIK